MKLIIISEVASQMTSVWARILGRLKPRQSRLRVLVVGDSISQGQEGDYTWRYRMLKSNSSGHILVLFICETHIRQHHRDFTTNHSLPVLDPSRMVGTLAA